MSGMDAEDGVELPKQIFAQRNKVLVGRKRHMLQCTPGSELLAMALMLQFVYLLALSRFRNETPLASGPAHITAAPISKTTAASVPMDVA